MRNVPPGRGRDLEALVSAHSGLVRSFFLRRCACPEDAEDLAQESFLAIIEALPRFRGASAPSTWIWTICRHIFARLLGKPEGTIKYQLHILRARLGEALGTGKRRAGPRPR
jgi:DNA-directed RNA polymerase specialized sigma24 family protein